MSGRRAAVLDFNFTTPHLGLSLGCFAGGKTINNFLRQEAKLEDIIFTHQSGLHLAAASLEPTDLSNITADEVKEAIKAALWKYDYVFLDSAPGMGKEAIMAMKASDEAIYVANPNIPSAVDILKARNLSHSLNFQSLGIILNRVQRKKYELSGEDISRFAEIPVIAEIPEDDAMQKSSSDLSLAVAQYPKSRASRAIFGLAYQLCSPWQNPYSYRGRVS